MKNTKYSIHDTKYTLLVILFLVAFLERTVFDLGPNIELVTMAMILASFYFGRKQSFWLTFAILALTDLIIGNTYIFIFTWSGFLLPAIVVGGLIPRTKIFLKGINLIKKITSGTFLGVGSNFFFFLWTNFGVWLLDSWGMYPKTLQGLITCYVNALPFYKMQVVSTVVFVTLGFFIIEVVFSLTAKFRTTSSTLAS